MLNEDLFDPKDLEIAKLKQAIKKFKEYDKERKKHYANLEQEVGALKAYIQELEGDETVKSLRKKIKDQKEANAVLRRKLHVTEKQLEQFYV